jgi:hypothetical protein
VASPLDQSRLSNPFLASMQGGSCVSKGRAARPASGLSVANRPAVEGPEHPCLPLAAIARRRRRPQPPERGVGSGKGTITCSARNRSNSTVSALDVDTSKSRVRDQRTAPWPRRSRVLAIRLREDIRQRCGLSSASSASAETDVIGKRRDGRHRPASQSARPFSFSRSRNARSARSCVSSMPGPYCCTVDEGLTEGEGRPRSAARSIPLAAAQVYPAQRGTSLPRLPHTAGGF